MQHPLILLESDRKNDKSAQERTISPQCNSFQEKSPHRIHKSRVTRGGYAFVYLTVKKGGEAASGKGKTNEADNRGGNDQVVLNG